MPDTSPYISATLGADLRALRKARSVTLIDLAERCGKSVGWLSQVERDISHPSIEELKVLAQALEVSVSIFFGRAPAIPKEEGYVVRGAARRRVGTGDNGLVEELLSPDLTDDFEMFHSTFEAGAEMAKFETQNSALSRPGTVHKEDTSKKTLCEEHAREELLRSGVRLVNERRHAEPNENEIKHHPTACNKDGCVCLSITESDVVFFGRFGSLLNLFTFIKSFFKIN